MIDKILGAIVGFGAASMFSKKKATSTTPRKRKSTPRRKKPTTKRTVMMPKLKKTARFNYDDYVSAREIKTVFKKDGSTVSGSKVISGAYLSNTPITDRNSSQFAKGGLTGATYIPINELKKIELKSGREIEVPFLYSGVWHR